jgi:hypothetical protein
MAPFTAPNPGIWRVGYTDAAGNTRMMNGYLDPASTANAAATITVSALPAAFTASGYDVYVYVYGNVPSGETRSFQFSMTGTTTTFTVTQVGPTDVASGFPGFVEVTTSGGAGSYVVFRNLSAASFTLTATPGTASMPQRRRCPVNGLQIVAPSGS